MHSETIRDFFLFLKNPNHIDDFNNPVLYKVIKLFKIYLIALLLLLVVNLLNRFLESLEFYSSPEHIIEDVAQSTNKLFSRVYLIIILLIYPVFEEFSFRLFLTKYNRKYSALSLSLIIGYIIYSLAHKYLWYFEHSFINNIIRYLYVICLSIPFIFIYLILSKRVEKNVKIKTLWDANFPVIFYCIAFLFAVLHIPFLNLDSNNYLFLPIILLPYFVYGVILGYVRIKLGILYSIILHIVLNVPSIFRTFADLK